MNQTIPFVFDRLKFEGVPLSDIPREDLSVACSALFTEA